MNPVANIRGQQCPMSDKRTPTALIILDGYGYSETTEHNAILAAQTPVMDKLWRDMPHALVHTSGMNVGLPDGQMGNSEVGHMNLGAGRIVYQEFTRITKAIQEGDFQHNTVLCQAVDQAVNADRSVHIMGLLSPGGVHSHEDHLVAMVELAASRGARQVYVHAFLDGRDTPPRSAEPSIQRLDKRLAELGVGYIASLVGRYYAMDRDNRWERVEQAYNVITEGRAQFTAPTALEGLAQAYARDENDEFVQATRIQPLGQAPVTVEDGDAVFFMNFRADRARELSRCFVEPDFEGFNRSKVLQLGAFVCLTQYAADIPAPCAFPPEDLVNTLGEFLANQGKTQLRIAETEKYAHVTFFFSGGREAEYEGETRILVPSPKVATYDLQPEMSAPEVTDRLVEAITQQDYDLIVCNYANGDMVGHTGDFDAAIKAVEVLDECVGRVVDALREVGGECLITADHGNAEQMLDPVSGQKQTAHTTFPVPLIYVPGPSRQAPRLEEGRLCDIAPTLLSMMNITAPEEMTGHSLVHYR